MTIIQHLGPPSNYKFMLSTSETECVFTARYELGLYIQFYVLPTQCIYVFFVWISEQTAIISLYSID